MNPIPMRYQIEAKRNAVALSGMNESLNMKQGDNIIDKWIEEMQKRAKERDIFTDVRTFSAPGEKPKKYLLISTDRNKLGEMVNCDDDRFFEIREYQKENGRGITLLDYVMYEVSDVNAKNFFAKNQEIMRQIEDMSIVKTAMIGEGYLVPKQVSTVTITSIQELDEMRADPDVPEVLRKKWQKNYENAVADYARMYSKKYDGLTQPDKHEVKMDYFVKNHIAVTNEAISPEFFKFLKENLYQYPSFLYCKARTPYLKTKNLSKMSQKAGVSSYGIKDYWAHDRAKNRTYFSFPTAQEPVYYSLLNEFNTRDAKGKIEFDELMKSESPDTPLQTIYVNINDLKNWDSLCTANQVPYCINHGQYGDEKIDATSAMERIPMLVRFQDMPMTTKIVDRLSREQREYDPRTEIMKDQYEEEVEKKHPKKAIGMEL